MDLKCDSIATTDHVLELHGPVPGYSGDGQKLRKSLSE